jgi:hypothetical protein
MIGSVGNLPRASTPDYSSFVSYIFSLSIINNIFLFLVVSVIVGNPYI